VIPAAANPHVPGRDLRRLLLFLLLVVPGSLPSSAVYGAQSRSTENAIEEIIVTARRRDESITAVPMTITSLDGAMLDKLQFRNIDEFLSLSPGVMVYTGGDAVSSRVSIRGVVSPGQWVEPGNAIYVDEIYASGMLSVLPGFYDIASVQVLKGPQAGLYGRNTMGGAVLISTAQPTDEREARIDASYAQYDDRQVDGMLNAPLTDQVRLRAVGWYSDKNGGYHASGLDNQNLDTGSEQGGRFTLAVLPNERTDFSLTGAFDEIDEGGIASFGGVVEGAQLGPPPLAPESRRDVLRDDLGGLSTDQVSINSKLDVDTDAGAFIAVAGWRQIKLRGPDTDYDRTAYEASYADYLADPSSALKVRAPEALTSDHRDSLLNAEVRYLTPDTGGSLKAQFGVSYFEENARFYSQIVPLRDYALILADMGVLGDFTEHVRQDTNSWAGFGELIWTPRDNVEITTELRYTWERKNFDYRRNPTGIYARSILDFDLETSETFTNWSPGITLAYRPADTQTVYVKYVRGFHAGGFNTLVHNPALLAYDSEEAQNYEIGGKALLLDQRLEVGASIFYLRIDNALLPRPDQAPDMVTLFPLQNAVVAETTGMEIDLAMQVNTGLTLTASTGVYDSEVSVSTAPAFGNRAYVPDFTASLVADYQRPLTTSITGIATLGYRHRSGGRVPSLFHVEMDSYNLVDAQLGVIVDRILIAGFVQNALNDHYMVTNFDLTSGQYRYVAASGLNPLTTRAIVRDPGIVFGVRAAVTF
jgi:iron complex outermembrane recepter protein